MVAESLKEYLVKLGWDLDEKGFRKAIEQFSNFEGKADGFVGKLTKRLATAGGIVFSIISSTAVATGKLLDSVSDADRATERFARRMWTTKENARSFLTALDAMDAEYEDIFYMTPEEYQRFISLKNFGQGLEAPAELNETLKLVRDIQYEFSRLKVIANYGTQWIAYYIGRYMGADLEEIGTKFRDFNDWLTQHIPPIAEKISRILTTIIRLGKTGVRFITDLVNVLGKLWDKMSDGTKATVGFGAAFLGLLKMGPIGLFIGALFLILTLLEDFYNWKDGKPSAFTGMWEDLSGWMDKVKENGQLDGWIEKVDTLGDGIWKLIKGFAEFARSAVKWADDVGLLGAALDFIAGVVETIGTMLGITGDALEGIADFLDGKKRKLNPDGTDPDYPYTLDENGNRVYKDEDTKKKLELMEGTNLGVLLFNWFNEMTGKVPKTSGGYSGIDAVSSAAPYIDQSTTDINMSVYGYEKESAESATHRAATEVIKNVKKNRTIR